MKAYTGVVPSCLNMIQHVIFFIIYDINLQQQVLFILVLFKKESNTRKGLL